MKVLVCGGRDYGDLDRMLRVLDKFHAKHPISVLIHGGAQGADILSGVWAERRGVHCATVLARWNHHGKKAGPMRNAAMLELKPDAVIAFPGGRGTADMVRQAEAAGVKVYRIDERTEANSITRHTGV